MTASFSSILSSDTPISRKRAFLLALSLGALIAPYPLHAQEEPVRIAMTSAERAQEDEFTTALQRSQLEKSRAYMAVAQSGQAEIPAPETEDTEAEVSAEPETPVVEDRVNTAPMTREQRAQEDEFTKALQRSQLEKARINAAQTAPSAAPVAVRRTETQTTTTTVAEPAPDPASAVPADAEPHEEAAPEATAVTPPGAPAMTADQRAKEDEFTEALQRTQLEKARAIKEKPVYVSTQVAAETEKTSYTLKSLYDIMKLAYGSNPTIRAARAQLRAIDERLPQAQAGWKPGIDLSAGVDVGNVESDPDTGEADGSTSRDASLSLNQPLYRGGRTVAQTESAKRQILAQRNILSAVEQDIMLQVVTSYMDVLRDKALLDLNENNKTVIGQQLRASRDRFEVGEITRTDVSQAEARMAQAEADRVNALGNLRTSRAIYEQVVGAPAAETFDYPDLAVPLPTTLDEAIQVAMESNPNLVATRYLEDAANHDINVIKGELFPELNLVGSIGREYDPQPGTFDEVESEQIGLRATIPLYESGAVRSRVREAREAANRRRMEILEQERQVRQDVSSAWENLAAARAEIESRKAQVEASRLASEGVHREAELGSRTVLDALDADQELLDAQTAHVIARRNEVVARFALSRALGLLTPEQMGFPDMVINHNAHLNDVESRIFSMDTVFDGEK